jgi:predicted DNA-binding protein YlxM (UPF0122 family)
MNENNFKRNKPAACTLPPWAVYIPKEIRTKTLYKIKQESLELYEKSLDECPKRLVCLGKSCIGRPLPWDSPTAKPYLEQLAKTQKIINNEMFIQTCNTCEISNICKKPCSQVSNFLERDKRKEAILEYKEDLEYLAQNYNTESKKESINDLTLFIGTDIPWDCLNSTRKTVIYKYLYQRIDFSTIAKQENLNNQARSKYEYYAGLTTLSEYAIMRKFLKESGHLVTSYQLELLSKVYLENKSIATVAREIGITRQAAQQRIARVVDKFNLKWHIFVRKAGNKVIYNIPEVIR